MGGILDGVESDVYKLGIDKINKKHNTQLVNVGLLGLLIFEESGVN